VTPRRLLMILGLSAMLTLSADAAQAAIVRLHRSVTVDKGLIRLGDVAQVHADDETLSQAIRNVMLGPAPIPGNRRRFNLEEIQARLRAGRVSVGTIEFRGNSLVVVTRPQRSGSSESPGSGQNGTNKDAEPEAVKPLYRTQLASQSESKVRTIASLRDVSTADIRLADTIVHDLVRAYLKKWAPDWGNPFIRPLLSTDVVPTILAARNGNLEILSGKLLNEDHFLLTIAVPDSALPEAPESSFVARAGADDGRTHIRIRVRVTRRPKVLAARRSIARGQLIRQADLKWIEADDERNGATDPEELVGMEARQLLRAGDPIRVESVKPAMLIERGRLVKVTSAVGSVRVTGTYKARKSGAKNELIELETLDGERRLLARVTGVGRAELLNEGVSSGSSESGVGITYTDRGVE